MARPRRTVATRPRPHHPGPAPGCDRSAVASDRSEATALRSGPAAGLAAAQGPGRRLLLRPPSPGRPDERGDQPVSAETSQPVSPAAVITGAGTGIGAA